MRVSEYSVSPRSNHCLSASAVDFRVRRPGTHVFDMIPSHRLDATEFRYVQAVRITHHTAKNRQASDPVASWFTASHTSTHEILDLPRALFDWARHAQLSADDPFFSRPNPLGGRVSLSPAMMSNTIKSCARALGLGPTRFNSHSLRIGGATALRASGASADQVLRAESDISSCVFP